MLARQIMFDGLLAPLPLFLPNSELKQTKNRLTLMLGGSILENAPKEIHFESHPLDRNLA
jgi:hypothetical protein